MKKRQSPDLRSPEGGISGVVSDKTYDMQPTVKITSKLEDVA